MSSHSHEAGPAIAGAHRHADDHAGHHHEPVPADTPEHRLARSSLLMQGVSLRLLGAAAWVLLLWLAVAWALKEAA